MYTQITKEERLVIQALLTLSMSIRDIGRALGRSHSSISRELYRNKNKKGYDAHKAGLKARVRRLCAKRYFLKVTMSTELETYITEKLHIYWSPEQIAHRVVKETNGMLSISKNSIYKWLYSVFGQHLCQYLKTQRTHPKQQKGTTEQRGRILDMTSIHDRPEEINDRSTFGHWEVDTLGRKKGTSHTLTGAIERKSLYFLAYKVSHLKDSMFGFDEAFDTLEEDRILAVQSATFDRGVENKHHQELGIPTFFCDPYSSWQKGQIENMFSRLRRFIPKGTDLKNYSQEQIDQFVEFLNNTPRKKLDWLTPKEVFEQELLKLKTIH